MRVGVTLPARELGDDPIAIRDFAQGAEALGLSHLRLTDQVMRPDSGPLPEMLTQFSYLAAVTERIEFVSCVLILPLRETVLFARQSAQLDRLSGGRLRLGIGVGASEVEYQSLGIDFGTRGRRCDEQLALLEQLWTQPRVSFSGAFHQIDGNGIDPRPEQPIPIWVGGRRIPSDPVVRRIGRFAAGWFVLAAPDDYPAVRARVDAAAIEAGRDPAAIATEASLTLVGERAPHWQENARRWIDLGVSQLCLRTLGGGLKPREHLPLLEQTIRDFPVPLHAG